MFSKKFIFIDRDGTLISNKLSLSPGVIPALLALQKAGFRLVMITHQDGDGLGTASFTQAYFYSMHHMIIHILTSQGIVFDQVWVCPHLPADQCDGKTALVAPWLTGDVLDKENSYVIGDRETDMTLAHHMGINGWCYQRDALNWQDICEQLTCRDRHARVKRVTRETAIDVEIWLDLEGNSKINTGISFFDHMLDQIATHGGLRMNIDVKGDLHIDSHHTIEDTALTLGEALKIALGDKLGIGRFGFVLPMDECLARCTLDISGRPHLSYKAKYNYQRVGDISTDMVEHFFQSLSYAMACTLHLRTKGKNDHHRVESLFKVFGRTLRQAIRVDGDTLPSSKEVL